MKEFYNEIVTADTFERLRDKKTYEHTMPIRRRYLKLIPEFGFALSEDTCLLVGGPTSVRFQKRGSLQTTERKIRQAHIVNKPEPHIKLYLI